MTLQSIYSPGDNDNLKDHVGKCREAAEYLRLIQHSKSCFGNCNNAIKCTSIKELIHHVESCIGNCLRRGCIQTKKILQHYKTCKKNRQDSQSAGSPAKFCLVCSLAVRDEGLSKTASSINYYSGDAMVKRKFEDTDFAIPMLPKRFRDIHMTNSASCVSSSSSAAKKGIAVQTEDSFTRKSDRSNSVSSPNDIATRLSNNVTHVDTPIKDSDEVLELPVSPVKFCFPSESNNDLSILNDELLLVANHNASSIAKNGSPRGRWLSL